MYVLNHSQYRDHVLPVLIEDCPFEKLSWTLEAFEMVDLKAQSIDGYRHLFRTWGIGYDPTL